LNGLCIAFFSEGDETTLWRDRIGATGETEPGLEAVSSTIDEAIAPSWATAIRASAGRGVAQASIVTLGPCTFNETGIAQQAASHGHVATGERRPWLQRGTKALWGTGRVLRSRRPGLEGGLGSGGKAEDQSCGNRRSPLAAAPPRPSPAYLDDEAVALVRSRLIVLEARLRPGQARCGTSAQRLVGLAGSAAFPAQTVVELPCSWGPGASALDHHLNGVRQARTLSSSGPRWQRLNRDQPIH